MNIGIYASIIASEKGHERNVSAHIQLPLETARRLKDLGHDVHLITNRYKPNLTLPECLPANVPLHLVEDGRKRPEQLRGAKGRGGIRPLVMRRQLSQIRQVARSESLDVLHLFGVLRTGMLGGVLRLTGLQAPVVLTVAGGISGQWRAPLNRCLLRRIGMIITSTRYTTGLIESLGHEVELVRHGIVRNLTAELGDEKAGPRNRVLFWRDPSPENGADLCRDAFDRLAPEFPDVHFDFAVRPIWNEVDGLDALAQTHSNVHVYRFPYEDGVTLPRLIAESLLVVMPFRSLSVNPQFAIAESIAAGVPVVTSDLDSNPEIVFDGINGALVPVGELEPLNRVLHDLLGDRPRLETMRRSAAASFAEHWNWESYATQLIEIYDRIILRDRT